jgi:hypothetical protein
VNPGRIDKRIRERGAFEHNTIVAEGRRCRLVSCPCSEIK